MPAPTRVQLADLRGASRLLFDATAGVVDVVERMHRTIERRPGPLGEEVDEATHGITGLVYRNLRGGLRLFGRGVDLSLAPFVSMLPDGGTTAGRDTVVSIVNGVYGDHLAHTANPLAIDMSLRRDDGTIQATGPVCDAAGAPARRLLVLVHGLCLSEHSWRREGAGHGAALAAEFGCVPLYLRYNSGLRIVDNGRRFATLLEALVARSPGLDEVALVGHSMGGLVVRSAVHVATAAGHGWPHRLRRIVFLGTPHHGSPLERGGRQLDLVLGLSPYAAPIARLGRRRSAGIQDLRHGAVSEVEREVVPLPDGVACYAVAATLASRQSPLAQRLVGDGLVPLDSALGRHGDRARSLRFAPSHQWVAHQTGHLELLQAPAVLQRLRGWWAEAPEADLKAARRSGRAARPEPVPGPPRSSGP